MKVLELGLLLLLLLTVIRSLLEHQPVVKRFLRGIESMLCI